MPEYAGYRTELQVELGVTWTTVAQIRDLDGPALESDQIEVSHRGDDSGFDRYRRYVAGLADGGEVNFEIVFDPDHESHDPTLSDSMYAYADSGEVANFRLNFPGVASAVTRAAFAAFVSSFEVKSPLEDGLMADLTLKITGRITWTHVP